MKVRYTPRHGSGTPHHWLAKMIADWCADHEYTGVRGGDGLLYPPEYINAAVDEYFKNIDDLVDQLVIKIKEHQ